MRTHEFILRIRLTRDAARGLLAAALFLGPAGSLNPGQNTLKWTAYYPSPNGVFMNLTSNNESYLATTNGDVSLGGNQGCGFNPAAPTLTKFTDKPPVNCADAAAPRVVRVYDKNIAPSIGGVEPSKDGSGRSLPILHVRGDIWVDRLFWSDLPAAGIERWPADIDSNFSVDKCPNINNCSITKKTTLKINWSITEGIALRKDSFPEKDPKTGEIKFYKLYGARSTTRIRHSTAGGLFIELKPTWKILQPDTGLPWPKWPPLGDKSATINGPGTPGYDPNKISGSCTYTPIKRDLKGFCELYFPTPNSYNLFIELK